MPTRSNTSSGRPTYGPRPRLALAAVAVALLAAASACQQMAAVLAVASGGDEVEAEYTFDESRVALLVDDVDQLGMPVEAQEALFDGVRRQFESHKVKASLVPWSEVQRIRQTRDDYDDLSIREIGEALGAERVLYVRITWWALRDNPGDPQLHGRCRANVKVLSTERKRDVRLWPEGRDGRTIEVRTDPVLSDAPTAEPQLARTLALKTAEAVARLFFDYKPMDE